MNIFKHYSNRLNRCVKACCADYKQFLVNPDVDFSRKSPLTFAIVAGIPFQLHTDSVNNTLPLLEGMPSVSSAAVSMARAKINFGFYKAVFDSFNKKTAQDCPYHGYRIACIDGSEVSVSPYKGNNAENEFPDTMARSKKGGHRHYFHLNAAYNPCERTFIGAVIQPGSQKNEDAALLELCSLLSLQDIIVSDRGYESLITFYLLAKEGRKFVIRIKDESSSTSILKHYPTPNTEEYDIDFNVILTSKNNTYVKNHWDTYKYISSYKKCGLFSEEVTELPLNLRVVRYKAVSEGVESFITVITNLSREEFTAQQIAEIYGLRWREEVGFRGIKEELGLNKMHSRNPETVKGEIYAKMTMFNLASRIRNALDKKEKKRKHIHHPSFSLICTIVKKFAFSKRIPKDIDEKILRHTIPERPGRQDLRKKKS
jgi:hypothetical protein